MQVLHPVEILITNGEIKYNYNGTLYTKEEFEKKFLQPKYMVVYKEFDNKSHNRIVVVGEYFNHEEAKEALEDDVEEFVMTNNRQADIRHSEDYVRVNVLHKDWGCEWWLITK